DRGTRLCLHCSATGQDAWCRPRPFASRSPATRWDVERTVDNGGREPMNGDAPLVGIPGDMPRLLESDPDLPDELIDRILDGQAVEASAPLEAHLLAGWVAT